MLPFVSNFSQFKNKRVLLRAGLNAPIENGRITSDFKLKRIQPTIVGLRDAGAHTVIIGHNDGEGETQTLKPVADYLGVRFASTRSAIGELTTGDCVMLENLRRDPREKANDDDFARELVLLGEVFINDAFADSHRRHASIVGVPKFLPSFLGPQFQDEVDNLSRALSPAHPFLFILGGAKFSTKLSLVNNFLAFADHVIIAGALANNFFKAQGYEVGKSLVDAQTVELAPLLNHPKILLPSDVTAVTAATATVKSPSVVRADENMIDIGPQTVATIDEFVHKAKFILWNGPLGNFELGFGKTTDHLALSMAASRAETVVGGGDTLAALARLGLDTRNKSEGGFDFVSTGGGAMLDFLANRTLPGIEAVICTG